MMSVENASDWLLNILSVAKEEEITKVCIILWGIWVRRNKKVWEGKNVTAAIAMDSSFKSVEEWRKERFKCKRVAQAIIQKKQTPVLKWEHPAEGVLKINVDASLFTNSATFTVGMVLRNHGGDFLAGRNLCLASPATVFEAEAIGVREALSWIKQQELHNHKLELESDSLCVVQGIKNRCENLLEVGEVIEQCRILLGELADTSIHFVRNQANRVAHEIARLPCLVNCHNDFTSPPMCLVETILLDAC